MDGHQTTATEHALRARCAARATGRLSVEAGSGPLVVHLLDGEVVGVRAEDDAAVLVDRLSTRGDLTVDRARELQAMQAMAGPILGRDGADPILGLLLDQIPDHVLDDVLGARFEEVLLGFLGATGEPVFVADVAPWTHLVRTAGGTPSLLDALLDARATAESLDPRQRVAVGGVAPLDLVEAALVAPLVAGPRPVIDLVERLAAPTVLTLARVARALARGVLVPADVPSLLAPIGPAPEDPVAPADAEPPPVEAPEAVAEEVVEVDPAEPDEPEASAPPAPLPDEAPAPLPDEAPAPLLDEAPAPLPDEAPAPLPDEELEAFSGSEDERRGGSRDGTFVQDARSLDRVELAPEAAPPEPTFSAPSLSEDDAVDKLDVANGVLRAVYAALARASGPREARGALQVLVDGRPRAFVSLYDGIVVGASGDLPLGPILANLRRRLPTEQRHLLNQGLIDLLDRTLDRVADELPDEAFDTLLEQVIGYRQRLGL